MTLTELERLEAFQRKTELTGDALYKAFNQQVVEQAMPLCVPRDPKDPYKQAREYCLGIRQSINDSRERRGADPIDWDTYAPLPEFFRKR